MFLVSAFRYVPIETLAVSVLLGVVGAVVAVVLVLRRGEPAAAMLRAARVLLAGSAIAVLVATMMSGAGGTGANLVPGAGIRAALNNPNRGLGLLNLLGNMVMFLPVGFLLPLAVRLRFRTAVASCAVLSAMIELVQLLMSRSLDVDDVLLNTLGGAVGAGLGVAVAAGLRRRARHYPGANPQKASSRG